MREVIIKTWGGYFNFNTNTTFYDYMASIAQIQSTLSISLVPPNMFQQHHFSFSFATVTYTCRKKLSHFHGNTTKLL